MKTNLSLDISSQNLLLFPKISSEIESLCADNNSITSISNLPKTIINLSLINNKLTFITDLNAQIPSLQCLNLSYNRLVSIEGLFNCINLKELRLNDNYIGDDSISVLSSLVNLEFLDISNNHLRSSSEILKILSKLNNLEELWNCGNEFSEWIVNYSMMKLKNLVMDKNKIKKIQFNKELPALQRISCKENQIVYINFIENAYNLIEIDISNNKLTEIPKNLEKLRNIRILIAKNNSLSVLPNIQTLEILDISSNSLTRLPEFSKNIKKLIASHNKISELPNYYSLISVDLSCNKLKSIEFIKHCKSLECFYIGHNELNNSSEVLKYLQNKKLEKLDLTGFELSENKKKKLLSRLPELIEFNKENILEKNEFAHQKEEFLSSTNWDALRNSRLFPSCRSSTTNFERNTPSNYAKTFNSIFSDIRPSALSSISNMRRYEEDKQEATGRFSIEMEKRIRNNENRQTGKYLEKENYLDHLPILELNPKKTQIRNYSQTAALDLPKKIEKKTSVHRKKKHYCRHHSKKHRDLESILYESSDADKAEKENINLEEKTIHNLNKTVNYNLSRKEADFQSKKAQEKAENSSFFINNHRPQDFSQLFIYSKTPIRPILHSEKDTTIISKLSQQSNEFLLVSELVNLEGFQTTYISKIYTYSLIERLKQKSLENNRKKQGQNNFLLFHSGLSKDLYTISNNSKGFSAVYNNIIKYPVKFATSVRGSCKDFNENNVILLCLLDVDSVKIIQEDIFAATSLDNIIPIYLIEFSL